MNDVEEWIMDPQNHDQDADGKNDFLKSAKVGSTRLKAVGISNGELRKYATRFIKNNQDIPFVELISAATKIFQERETLELQLFIVYLLEKRKSEFNQNLFQTINEVLIDTIDYWAIADHFCINLFGYFPLTEPEYYEIINSWKFSGNFWRRRLSISSYLKVSRENPHVLDHVISNIQDLIEDDNYYVRKAFPWLLRESTRKIPENRKIVFQFLKDNINHLNKTELRNSIKYLSKTNQQGLLKLYEKL